MKALVIALIATVSINAFAARYVTVRVCDGGESGTECRTVTYKVRSGGGAPATYQTCTGEGTPCTPERYGVPRWLRALSDMFPGSGGPVEHPGTGNGGPN